MKKVLDIPNIIISKKGMDVAYSAAMAIDLSKSSKIIFVSGQLAFGDTGDIVGKGDIVEQTEQCIKNMQIYLQSFDADLKDVVEVVIFVKKIEKLKEIHRIRLKYFTNPLPTSTLVQIVDFVNPDALIEIKGIAIK